MPTCGVLTGFVAVILVLTLTPGFVQERRTLLFETMIVLFSISAFGYVVTAFGLIGVSASAPRDFETIEHMRKDYAFNQVLVILFTAAFLGGVVSLTLSVGSLYIAIVVSVGLILVASEVIRNWWALTKRVPPKRTSEKRASMLLWLSLPESARIEKNGGVYGSVCA